MKKNKLKLILVFVTLLVTNVIIAKTSPNRVPPPPGVPLDGGLITLFVIAFGIAVKKLGFKK